MTPVVLPRPGFVAGKKTFSTHILFASGRQEFFKRPVGESSDIFVERQ